MGKKEEVSLLPRHVAIIMDGNGRWARKRLLPRFAGHRVGMESVRCTVRACLEKGVEALSLFAFSSENWRRPADEVSLLMGLFTSALEREVASLHDNGVRLRIIGDCSAFPEELQKRIVEAEALTRSNSALNLVIAVNYGGRWDITEAARQIASEVAAGTLPVETITQELIQSRLALSDLPEPDLFIRTSGEQRISNFMIWQLAYTELYFTKTPWPDFREEEFAKALSSFATRERRFGRTSEQMSKERAGA